MAGLHGPTPGKQWQLAVAGGTREGKSAAKRLWAQRGTALDGRRQPTAAQAWTKVTRRKLERGIP